ncbi:MAG: putative selenium-dependent hydroxylase accessory protein YqeC [Spirochaetaceae bacterium]|jgi:probable selenium-dependent hydroxylase accessory protein YqeC|nr:putative selenium-dependent hydroxylase accessory protein YqeC [Spirochaetaceae bacterium]
MKSLNAFFETFGENQRFTVIGCGGKTSLIEYLARNRRGLKTLVTTTTRMAFPSPDKYDYFRDYGKIRSFPAPEIGITLAGSLNEGKLHAIPLDLLGEIAPDFACVLIEGDGSRSLPLKAWADYEPVVPSCTTVTVGILPLWTLGMPVSEDIVHRLPLFTALTGARPGEPVSLEHLVSVITGNYPASGKGLFSNARGKRILFFNQVEEKNLYWTAQKLASLLPRDFLANLSGIIAGSVRQGRARAVYVTEPRV